MDLPKEKAQELLESKSRRNFLKAAGGLGAVVGIASGQLDSEGQGNLYGGNMALEQAYRVSDKQWIGPDSAKSNVEAKSGRVYKAVDTEVEYYGDSGNWTGPMSVGSSSQPVPSVSTDKAGIGDGWYTVDPAATLGDIQDVINAANPGDTVVLPDPTNGAFIEDGTLGGPLVIDKRLTLKGLSTPSVIGQQPAPDSDITDVDGTVLRQDVAGADAIKITAQEAEVNLENLYITWADSLKDSDTGHGVHAVPPDDGSGNKESGVFYYTFRKCIVDRHDGDHYGYRIINPQHGHIDQCKAWQGGGIEFVNDHSSTHYGNTVLTNFYASVQNAGTAHGIHHDGPTESMNLNLFLRPQVNMGDLGTSQMHATYTGFVYNIGFVGGDFEGGGGGVDMPPQSMHLPLFTYKVQNEPSTPFKINGSTSELKAHIRDDFGDNDLGDNLGSGRTEQIIGRYYQSNDGPLDATYRPDWSSNDNPSATGGEMEVPGGARVNAPTTLTVGEWEWEFRFGQSSSTGLNVRPLLESGGPYIEVQISDDSIDLRKFDGSTTTTLINGTYTTDTAGHICRLTRDTLGNYELILDGTSIGTVTDTFTPNVDTWSFYNYGSPSAYLNYIEGE